MKTTKARGGNRWMLTFVAAASAGSLACSSSSSSPAAGDNDAATDSAGGSSSGSSSGASSSGSSSGGSSSGGSSSGGSSSGSSSGGSSGSSSGSSGGAEGGLCGGPLVDGGVCNVIANVGSLVTQTCATGTPPTQTGGTILDGTYVVISTTNYNCGDAGPAPATSETDVVSGGCLQLTASRPFDGGTQSVAFSSSFSVSGNQITTTAQCPTVGTPGTSTFTATSTMVTTLSTDGNLVVLMKQ